MKKLQISVAGLLLFFKINLFAQGIWLPLGSGLKGPNTVRVLFADTLENALYAGGNFSSAGGDTNCTCIAKWKDNQWYSLGTGVEKDLNGVWSIIRYKNYIYAGGAFSKMNGIPLRGLARWDGTTWESPPGGGLGQYGTIVLFFVYNDELYAWGRFDSIGGIAATSIAKFDGTKWMNVGLPIKPPDNWTGGNRINDIRFYKGELCIVGDIADSLGYAPHIWKWNGLNWETVGGGFKGLWTAVGALEVYQDELYVGGGFLMSQGNPGNNIARWDGTQWNYMEGVYPDVAGIVDMKAHNNKLYAVGLFKKAGPIWTDGIAIWDGNYWEGFSNNFDNTIGTLTFLNNELYIAGGFWTIDGDSINYIAKYSIPFTDTVDTDDNNMSLRANIVVSPNPATRNLSIKFNLKSPPRTPGVTVTLYTLCGQEVYREYFGKISGTTEKTIDLSSLAQGMYLCKVRAGGEIVYRKVVRY